MVSTWEIRTSVLLRLLKNEQDIVKVVKLSDTDANQETKAHEGEKGSVGKKRGRDRRNEEGRECNRKLLSELPMASSQSVQTLKNSRQRAGREGRCQEGGREARNEKGGEYSWFVVKGRAHA